MLLSLFFFSLLCIGGSQQIAVQRLPSLCARVRVCVPVSGVRVCVCVRALPSLWGKPVASSAAGSLWLYWQSPLSLHRSRYRRETARAYGCTRAGLFSVCMEAPRTLC